jgi:hypothetical protein
MIVEEIMKEIDEKEIYDGIFEIKWNLNAMLLRCFDCYLEVLFVVIAKNRLNRIIAWPSSIMIRD